MIHAVVVVIVVVVVIRGLLGGGCGFTVVVCVVFYLVGLFVLLHCGQRCGVWLRGCR